jgi:hypothetical protein
MRASSKAALEAPLLFSLSEDDAKTISARLGQEGFLVLSDAGVSDIARLWHIQAKTVLGNQIDPGWYYNVRDFVEKMLLIAPLLSADVQKPMMQGVFTSDDRALVAIPLHNLVQGLYMLTTSVASGQRAGQVLGGESHPKEGFLIQIDPATEK